MQVIPFMTRRENSAGNPGDVFIGWGLKYLISQVIRDPTFLLLDKFKEDDFKLHEKLVKKAGYVIYAGTPQYNRYSDWCFWYDKEVYENYVIPWGLNFYPLAGGSGGHVDMTPTEFSRSCREDDLTKKIMAKRQAVSRITTVRDNHSYQLLKDMKWKSVSLLPCTALWTSQWSNLPIKKAGPVVLVPPNHSQIPPSYFKVDNKDQVGEIVKRIFLQVEQLLKKQGRECIYLCHGHKEFKIWERLPNAVYTNDIQSLIDIYCRCEGVISARLHGAIPVAGMNKPSILIGIDTRMSAADVVGIPSIPITAKDIAEKIASTYLVTKPIDITAFESSYKAILRDVFKIQNIEIIGE